MNYPIFATIFPALCLILPAIVTAGPTTRPIADGRASIAIPDGWRGYQDDRYPDSLSVCDPTGRAFLWASGESSDDFVDMTVQAYAAHCARALSEQMQDAEQSEVEDLTVNQLSAARVVVRGVQDGVKWVYVYTLIEGERNYYMVVLAARPSKLEVGLAAMEQILLSFKELPDSDDPSAATRPGN